MPDHISLGMAFPKLCHNCVLRKFQVCSSVPSMKKGPFTPSAQIPVHTITLGTLSTSSVTVCVFIIQINTVALIYSSSCLDTSQ